jgi:hypothetical protein
MSSGTTGRVTGGGLLNTVNKTLGSIWQYKAVGYTIQLIRRTFSLNGVTYCFVFMDDIEPRNRRKKLLSVSCYVARGNISGTYFSFNLNKIISVRFDFTFQQWSYNNHIWTYWTYGARL